MYISCNLAQVLHIYLDPLLFFSDVSILTMADTRDVSNESVPDVNKELVPGVEHAVMQTEAAVSIKPTCEIAIQTEIAMEDLAIYDNSSLKAQKLMRRSFIKDDILQDDEN